LVPEGSSEFFVSSVGASATLIGLLFVAIAVEPASIVGEEAPVESRSSASSSFMALLNVFFVSLAGTVPPINVGFVAAIVAAVGLFHALGIGVSLWRESARQRRRVVGVGLRAGVGLVIVSLVTYAWEFWYAVRLAQEPQDAARLYGLVFLLFAVYGIALGRAWELLGARKKGGLLEELFSALGLRRTRGEEQGEDDAPRR
jgi:multidrug transporter EmrE-like cation transporter